MIDTFLSALATTAGITCGLLGVFLVFGAIDRLVTRLVRAKRKPIRERVVQPSAREGTRSRTEVREAVTRATTQDPRDWFPS